MAKMNLIDAGQVRKLNAIEAKAHPTRTGFHRLYPQAALLPETNFQYSAGAPRACPDLQLGAESIGIPYTLPEWCGQFKE